MPKSKIKKYVGDFETTTDIDDCRVWGYGICEIGNEENFKCGNSLDEFIEVVKSFNNSVVYFHNLKFDLEFIFYWLYANGFQHITNNKEKGDKTFSTLISDKGFFYGCTIYFDKNTKVEFIDSLKILPFKVSVIAKAFGLPILKGEIDYNKYREVGHELELAEIAYIKNDVQIVAMALNVLFGQGLTKMTQGANALYDYKRMIGNKNFARRFPTLMTEYDELIRESYKGGFVYLNPKHKEKELKNLVAFDVNSLYPWVMRTCNLPYGHGLQFFGEYEKDELYPLYVQTIRCTFKLKENHIPTISLRRSLQNVPLEYLSDSGPKEITMCLTSIDLKLFFNHYDVYNIEYMGGWKFKSSNKLFIEYVDKWYDVKNESKINNNKGMYALAKLMLNALYGKFGSAIFGRSKFPYFDNETGLVKYRISDREERKGVFIPVASFITSWSRYTTITACQANYDRFVYADTDSMYLLGNEMPVGVSVDDNKLGCWSFDKIIKRGKFLRQKSYILECAKPGTDKFDVEITCAGMPATCYPHVKWEDFKPGKSVPGKLQAKRVKGGVVLIDQDFTFKSTL